MPRVLVIDDQFGRDLDARRDLCAIFGLEDVTGDDSQAEPVAEPLAQATFASGQTRSGGELRNRVDAAMAAVRTGWPFPEGGRWALLLLDLRFVSGRIGPDGVPEGRPADDEFGLQVLESIKAQVEDLPVVILSSRQREDVIEACRRLGAADFIQRVAAPGAASSRATLAAKLSEYGLLEDEQGRIVGRSLALLQALAAARRAATGGGNILLLGETGTGKELAARYLHDHSPNASGPYQIFHAFGTTETLQEDELFGHVRGAFTDAKSERAGLFELASGGTLFMDEIGDISASLQNKLLRPIESRSVSRQGDSREIAVDLQVVLATNKALDEYAATGRFKFDLLNRIRAYPITLPPLRHRREDIPLLADSLLKALCNEYGARWPRKIDSAAMDMLMAHDWRDGNVRELRNVLERVVKDNKDAEIVVAGDIRLDTGSSAEIAVTRSDSAPDASPPVPSLELPDFPVDKSYATLHGTWPPLQRKLARVFAGYLAAAIEATRKHRAGESAEGEINLSGAVSCLLGRQVPTVQAADFVKRLLQFDESAKQELLAEYPVLEEAFGRALRQRPSSRRKSKHNVEGRRE